MSYQIIHESLSAIGLQVYEQKFRELEFEDKIVVRCIEDTYFKDELKGIIPKLSHLVEFISNFKDIAARKCVSSNVTTTTRAKDNCPEISDGDKMIKIEEPVAESKDETLKDSLVVPVPPPLPVTIHNDFLEQILRKQLKPPSPVEEEISDQNLGDSPEKISPRTNEMIVPSFIGEMKGKISTRNTNGEDLANRIEQMKSTRLAVPAVSGEIGIKLRRRQSISSEKSNHDAISNNEANKTELPITPSSISQALLKPRRQSGTKVLTEVNSEQTLELHKILLRRRESIAIEVTAKPEVLPRTPKPKPITQDSQCNPPDQTPAVQTISNSNLTLTIVGKPPPPIPKRSNTPSPAAAPISQTKEQCMPLRSAEVEMETTKCTDHIEPEKSKMIDLPSETSVSLHSGSMSPPPPPPLPSHTPVAISDVLHFANSRFSKSPRQKQSVNDVFSRAALMIDIRKGVGLRRVDAAEVKRTEQNAFKGCIEKAIAQRRVQIEASDSEGEDDPMSNQQWDD